MEDYKEFLTVRIPQLLTELPANQKPLWGAMTAQQMVEHLHMVIGASSVLAKGNEVTTAIQIEWKNKIILGDIPMPKFLENPLYKNGMPAYENPTISQAADKLVQRLHNFYRIYESAEQPTNYHIFFGLLSFTELQRFHWKHFTHHFTQFGMLPITPADLAELKAKNLV